MTKVSDGGPAFPCAETESRYADDGMSLRDWVMGQCIAASFGVSEFLEREADETHEEALRRHWLGVAKAAAIAADAMIAARGEK